MLIWTGKENLTLAEHEEIIQCIASGDPDAAERSMIKHLDRSAALYVHQSGAPGLITRIVARLLSSSRGHVHPASRVFADS